MIHAQTMERSSIRRIAYAKIRVPGRNMTAVSGNPSGNGEFCKPVVEPKVLRQLGVARCIVSDRRVIKKSLGHDDVYAEAVEAGAVASTFRRVFMMHGLL